MSCRSPTRVRQNRQLPTKKSPETQLPSRIGGGVNSSPLERIDMATSLSSNHQPFHALLEDPAKSTKNSTADTLLAIAERKGEGSIASNGALPALTGVHTGRSPKAKFIFVDDETRGKLASAEINKAMQPEVFY